MPLLDHFHPPLSIERRWESFHSSWATRLADALTERWLPPDYIAEEHVHFGASVEIDVATFTRAEREAAPHPQTAVATVVPRAWTPPTAHAVLPAVFPETFEVRILSTEAGPKLVAAIELVSPGNKDRPLARRAFAMKCAGYLVQGISVIIVDIVTSRRANLHQELCQLLDAADASAFSSDSSLYAIAYRPIRRSDHDEIDIWQHPLAHGRALPTLPLGLRGDLAIPVDFEATYNEACLRKRLTGS
jgi:hypothetical protein